MNAPARDTIVAANDGERIRSGDYGIDSTREGRLQRSARELHPLPDDGGGENNSAIPDGPNEMLLQSHEGFLRLFPCWPAGRPAHFEGLRAYGAFLVWSELSDGRVQFIRLLSEKGLPCTLLNPWPGAAVSLHRNGAPAEPLHGDRLRLATTPGERLELTPCPPAVLTEKS